MKELTAAALTPYEGSYAVKVFDSNFTEQGPATLQLSGGVLKFIPGSGLNGSTSASASVAAVCENTNSAGSPIGVIAKIDSQRHVDFFSPAFNGLYVSGTDLGSAASSGRYLQGTSAKTAAPAPTPAPAPAPSPAPAPAPSPSPSAGNECAPLVAKAGDSVTYRQTSSSAGSAPYTVRYDFASGSFKGAAAVVGTVTVNGATLAQAGVGTIYLDPVTGAALGQDASSPGASDTVTSYDPPDWQQRLANAGVVGGSSGKIAVTATITGKSVTDGFASLGGATALVIKYEFLINRDANETVSTTAGAFANSCKFRVEFSLKDFQVQGPASTNPLLSMLLPTLQSSFVVPTQVTLWTTNAVPFMLPKSVTVSTLPAPTGAVTSTQELIAVTKAPR